MIRTVPEEIRREMNLLARDIMNLMELFALNRPVSIPLAREKIAEIAKTYEWLEEAILTDTVGCVDDDGQCWHPDDLVVLGEGDYDEVPS